MIIYGPGWLTNCSGLVTARETFTVQWMDSPVGTIYYSAVYDLGGPSIHICIQICMDVQGRGPLFGGNTDSLTVGTTLLFSL